MITRKPAAGLAAGVIMGLLGLLLVQLDTAPDTAGIALWMRRILGTFLLVVAAGSISVALFARRRGR